jgi:hypothetical protein
MHHDHSDDISANYDQRWRRHLMRQIGCVVAPCQDDHDTDHRADDRGDHASDQDLIL